MLRLNVITCSTRPGRIGPAVAKWFEGAARAHGQFEVVPVDLAEQNLPLLDEPEHPVKQKYQHDHTQRWSTVVDAGDAYVFVMPEYDYFVSAALVNALQCLSREWQYKPAGLVSYGGVSAGLRGQQALKGLTTSLKLVVPPESVAIQFVHKLVQDGAFKPEPAHEASAKTLLDELHRWATALKTMRPAAK